MWTRVLLLCFCAGLSARVQAQRCYSKCTGVSQCYMFESYPGPICTLTHLDPFFNGDEESYIYVNYDTDNFKAQEIVKFPAGVGYQQACDEGSCRRSFITHPCEWSSSPNQYSCNTIEPEAPGLCGCTGVDDLSYEITSPATSNEIGASPVVQSIPDDIPTSGTISSCFWNRHSNVLRAAGHGFVAHADLVISTAGYNEGYFCGTYFDGNCPVQGWMKPNGDTSQLYNGATLPNKWASGNKEPTKLWQVYAFNRRMQSAGINHQVRPMMLDDNELTWTLDGVKGRFVPGYSKFSAAAVLNDTTLGLNLGGCGGSSARYTARPGSDVDTIGQEADFPTCRSRVFGNVPSISFDQPITQTGSNITGSFGHGIRLPIADGGFGSIDGVGTNLNRMNKIASASREVAFSPWLVWTFDAPLMSKRAVDLQHDDYGQYSGNANTIGFCDDTVKLAARVSSNMERLSFYDYWARHESAASTPPDVLSYYSTWHPPVSDYLNQRREYTVPSGALPAGAQMRRPLLRTDASITAATTCTRGGNDWWELPAAGCGNPDDGGICNDNWEMWQGPPSRWMTEFSYTAAEQYWYASTGPDSWWDGHIWSVGVKQSGDQAEWRWDGTPGQNLFSPIGVPVWRDMSSLDYMGMYYPLQDSFSLHTNAEGTPGKQNQVRAWCGADLLVGDDSSCPFCELAYGEPLACQNGGSLAPINQCICPANPARGGGRITEVYGDTLCNSRLVSGSALPPGSALSPLLLHLSVTACPADYDVCSGRGACSVVNRRYHCECRGGWFGNASFIAVYVSQLFHMLHPDGTWEDRDQWYADYAQLHQCLFWDGDGVERAHYNSFDPGSVVPHRDALPYSGSNVDYTGAGQYPCARITWSNTFGGRYCDPCPVCDPTAAHPGCKDSGTPHLVVCDCKPNWFGDACEHTIAPFNAATGQVCSGVGVPVCGDLQNQHCALLAQHINLMCARLVNGTVATSPYTGTADTVDPRCQMLLAFPQLSPLGSKPYEGVCVCPEGYGGAQGACEVDFSVALASPAGHALCHRPPGQKVCGAHGACIPSDPVRSEATWYSEHSDWTGSTEVFAFYQASSAAACVCEPGWLLDADGACTVPQCPLSNGAECSGVSAAVVRNATACVCKCWLEHAGVGVFADTQHHHWGEACQHAYSDSCFVAQDPTRGVCNGNGRSPNNQQRQSGGGCFPPACQSSNDWALCSDANAQPECLCDPEFSGQACNETKLPLAFDDVSNPCNIRAANSGNTYDSIGCVCAVTTGVSYGGTACEIALSTCSPSVAGGQLCNGHGSVCNTNNDTCTCSQAKGGAKCDVSLPCDGFSSCNGHGECVDGTHCVCDESWGGTYCASDLCVATGGERVSDHVCNCGPNGTWFPRAPFDNDVVAAFVGCRKLCPLRWVADGVEPRECGGLGFAADVCDAAHRRSRCAGVFAVNDTAAAPACSCAQYDLTQSLYFSSVSSAYPACHQAQGSCDMPCPYCAQVQDPFSPSSYDCDPAHSSFNATIAGVSQFLNCSRRACADPLAVWDGTTCACPASWLFTNPANCSYADPSVCSGAFASIPSLPEHHRGCNCSYPMTSDPLSVGCISACGAHGEPSVTLAACLCDEFYTGRYCDQVQCPPPFHAWPAAAVSTTGLCDCSPHPQWTGSTCNVSACGGGVPRGANATLSVGCDCFPLWEGSFCHRSLCANGGSSNYSNASSCICTPGWTGPTCTISRCDNSTTRLRPVPADNAAGYTCLCGAVSTFDADTGGCTATVCANGGRRRIVNNTNACHCVNGWTGAFCDSHPCDDPDRELWDETTQACVCKQAFLLSGGPTCGEAPTCAGYAATHPVLPAGTYSGMVPGEYNYSGAVNSTNVSYTATTLEWLGQSNYSALAEGPSAPGLLACGCDQPGYAPREMRRGNDTVFLGCVRTCASPKYIDEHTMVLDPDVCECTGREVRALVVGNKCIVPNAPAWQPISTATPAAGAGANTALTASLWGAAGAALVATASAFAYKHNTKKTK